uniref:Uncharacterized protein n=1 Tax=Pristionchus pacificus TaxID=54126 RepID=A0A2A6B9V7_PRIPA|eukprot:PDM62665.1 hypothetical protein PRIPAC_49880 [Pristionchus pacificus]
MRDIAVIAEGADGERKLREHGKNSNKATGALGELANCSPDPSRSIFPVRGCWKLVKKGMIILRRISFSSDPSLAEGFEQHCLPQERGRIKMQQLLSLSSSLSSTLMITATQVKARKRGGGDSIG